MMKVIDTHTHLPGRYLGSTPRPIEELRQEFERDGLSGAWIMTLDGLYAEPAANNDTLAAQVRAHRDFFIPFCTVNPNDGADAACAELERSKNELGMSGLKLHPWLQAFSMSDKAVVQVLRLAGELGMPVLIHDGTPPYCSPLQIAAAAERAPDTAVILGHAGLDDLYEDAILACLRRPNIYLCCCSLSWGRVREVIRRCPRDRLLYGSDGGLWPGMIGPAIEKIQAACEEEATLKAILFENARRLLPLDAR